MKLTCNKKALGERVPIIVAPTDTDGNMISHATFRIGAAQARAGVHTPPADAGPVHRAVGIDLALGPTVGRGTQHVGQAVALALRPILARRKGVGTAGVRLAWVLLCHIRCNSYKVGHAKD